MKVQCESCGVVLNLPDDKLTPGSEFSFNCPKCKHKNNINVPAHEEAEAASPPPPPSADEFEDEEDSVVGEFFEEGAKPALICFDEGPTRTALENILNEMGYHPVIPSSTRDALQRIRVTLFNVILLDESYDGQNLNENSILRFLQPMDMTTRRRIFMALFGNDFQTLDDMTAYSLSVNAVINKADEGQFQKILQRGLAQYDRFYKVYFEVMREMGKT